METIVKLNNYAATAIDANNLKEAINILVEALHLTRNQFYHHLGSTTNGEEVGWSESVLCPDSSFTCRARRHDMAPQRLLTALPSFTQPHHGGIGATSTVTNNHALPCSGREPSLNQQGLFKFCSAKKYQEPVLAFQEEMNHGCYTISNRSITTTTSESHATSTIRLSALVVFNCAVSHDRLAESARSSATRRLLQHKAIALYEKVIDLYMESRDDHSTEQATTMTNSSLDNGGIDTAPRRIGFAAAQQDVIVMAAVNNLVQLHLESYQQRSHYSQLIMALFEDIQRTDYGSAEIQSHVDAQARVFVSNTVLSWNMDVEATVAAAA